MARNKKRNSKGRFMGFGRKPKRGKRRSFKGFGDMPSLDTLKSSVNGYDVLMGAGLGVLGVVALNMFAHDQKSQALNIAYKKDPWKAAAGALLGAAGAGVLAYSFMHKGEGGGAWTGRLVGAVGAGIALAANRLADTGYMGKKNWFDANAIADPSKITPVAPAAAPVTVAGYSALYPDSAVRGYGMLTRDTKAAPAALAALSMALDDGNEIERVLGG